jgi:ribonuclease HI
MERPNVETRELPAVPVIECDPTAARERLEAAGVSVASGNTDHERWRASHAGATAVAYDGKVVVQGADPNRLVGLLREDGGRAHVYFDGASRGNPGPAAAGYVVVTGDGIVAEGGETLGTMTNNRAEYGFDEIHLRGDSELIVKQVRGEWNTNDPDLRECRVRVHELLREFDDWTLEHVPREINERADDLANDALDDAA